MCNLVVLSIIGTDRRRLALLAEQASRFGLIIVDGPGAKQGSIDPEWPDPALVDAAGPDPVIGESLYDDLREDLQSVQDHARLTLRGTRAGLQAYLESFFPDLTAFGEGPLIPSVSAEALRIAFEASRRTIPPPDPHWYAGFFEPSGRRQKILPTKVGHRGRPWSMYYSRRNV